MADETVAELGKSLSPLVTLLNLITPFDGGADVTPDDSADLPTPARGLMVTVAGNVKVTMQNGDVLVWPALQPGNIYQIRAKRIWASSTTATGIKVGY